MVATSSALGDQHGRSNLCTQHRRRLYPHRNVRRRRTVLTVPARASTAVIFLLTFLALSFLPTALASQYIPDPLSWFNATAPEDDPETQDNLEDDGGKSLRSAVISKAMSALTAVYGGALLLNPHSFSSQIHAFTVMHATGFDKIEGAVVELRRDLRRAIAVAALRAPSLLLAAKSLSDYRDRIEEHRAVREEARRARRDGLVTAEEEQAIQKMKNRQMRRLRRDVKRMRKAGSALARVWDALDVDQALNVMRGLLFQMTAVLTSGKSNSLIGKTVSRYCHFLNLGGMFSEVMRRLDFPLARWIAYQEMFDVDLDDEERRVVHRVGSILSYTISAYMINFRRDFAYQLNGALVASTIITRGLLTLIGWREGVVGSFEEQLKQNSEGEVYQYRWKKSVSGAIIIALAALGLQWPKKMTGLPQAWLWPIEILEHCINRIILIFDKIL